MNIPAESSALVSIFIAHGKSNEFGATLAIDTASLTAAPVGESVRVDINTLGNVSVSLSALLHLLGTIKPLFPSAGHLVGVFEDSKEGRIILLPKPNETYRSNVRGFGHKAIIPL